MEFIETIKTFFKKIWNKIIWTADINKDGKLDKDDLKSLEEMTKKELEELGRTMGAELDRRLTKSKLIQQIKKLNKKL